MIVRSGKYYISDIKFYFDKESLNYKTPNKIEISIDEALYNSKYDSESVLLETLIILCSRYNANSWLKLIDKNNQVFTIGNEFLENKNYDVFYNDLFAKNFEASTILKESEKAFNIAFEFDSKSMNYEKDYDLHICVSKKKIVFISNKFDTKCLNILAKCFNSILNNFQKNKNQNVLETNLVNQKMFNFLNDNGKNIRDYDFSKPLYVMFEEQVKKTPHLDACIYLDSDLNEKKITYKELDEKSSILAYKLQQAGVTKEVPVCVYINRSINTFISILGIYKAGGIYVPLDLSYPEKYLKSILDEVKPKVLISNEKRSFHDEVKNIDINTLKDSIENKYEPLDTIENTAIIMYTSGSTGKPKGVKHRQLQVINRLNFMWEYYPFREGDTLAQRTTVNYMPSMWEFFGALLKGKTTIIFSDNIIKDPDLFLKLLHKYNVSYLTVVPSLFRMMTSNMEKFKKYAEGIRVWTSCGEPLTMELLKLFRKNLPNSVLINDYGSTETNGMLYFDSNFKDSGENILPHFKIVPNVNFYVFDNYMNQTPIGMAGNIYIGGLVKSTGYVNNEPLNKEKFVENPIKGSKDKILFKVGDRGVYHANGKIEVLGRVDHQVKIRGIRIDIDGIENVLEQNSNIERAVVIPKQQASGNKYLVAYIIRKNNDLTESDLRLYLEKNIPRYMMPTQFIFTNSLPLLPNGKIDRKKLTNLKADEEYVMKDKKVDEKKVINKIVQIASEVLGIKTEDIFIDKKFYELGFDSVSIVELLKQINTSFNLDLSLSDLYDNSSISDFYKNCFKDKNIVIEEKGNLPTNNKKQEELTKNREKLENIVKDMISSITMLEKEDINAEDFWQEIGMNLEEQNILIEQIQGKLRKKVTLLDIKKCNNIRELCAILEDIQESEITEEIVERSKEAEIYKNEYKNKIAVIGMACNYAGSPNKDKLWSNLIKEVNSISEIPKNRWNYKLEEDVVAYKWGGFVNSIEGFDYKYFHISEHEALLMDPQQKICLEQVYLAIEDSGYAIDDLSEKEVGVFIGARQGDYIKNLKNNNLNHGAYAFMGSDMAINSARISYLLNTKGPCMTIDTACSSSLTAIHEAVNSLKLDECEMAIAGGVSIMNTEHLHINSANMGMLSKEGQCKTFDNKADGFVPGEGVGIVILKNYEKAVADGDRIYGIILGSGINQDGRTNGITAPSKESQYLLEKKIYTKENINPETITYVEAHGTGTKLGDPIEIEALTKSFREWTDKKQYCAIGSIKTNIGHTVAASGAAAMIKVLLCLKNKVIPKSLNFNECNEYIDMKNSPFYVADKTTKWETNGIPRRAALSSFGFGGSNCHMVLEENNTEKKKRELDSYFIPISAASKESLESKLTNLKAWLKDNSGVHLGDISYTLTSIEKYKYRTALIVKSKEELLNLLEREQYTIVKKQPSNEKITEEFMDFNLQEVKERYLHNADLDVRKYFVSKGYEIVSLPSYPFNKKKCYIKYLEQEETYKELTVETIAEKYDMSKHILNYKKVLPGAAYIDYMCSFSKKKYDTLSNICFLKSVSEENFKDKIIINKIEKNNKLSIEIHTKSLQGEEVNALGEVSYTGCCSYKDADINSIKNRCSSYMGKEQFYDLFNSIKLNYGDDYSLIDEVYYNKEEALSRLSINNSKEYDFNPHIIDAAFQTVLPFLKIEEEQKNIYIPIAVEKIEIYGDINNVKYVYAKVSGNKENYGLQKYNIMILDKYGKILSSIFNFTRKKTVSSKKERKIKLFKPVEVIKECAVSNFKDDKYVLVINTDYNEWNYGKLRELYKNKIINISYSEIFRKVNKQQYNLCYENEEDFKKLFKYLSNDDIEFSKVINLAAYNHSSSNIDKSLNRSIYLIINLMKAYLALKDKNKVTIYTFFDSLKADTEYYEALTGFAQCENLEQNLIKLNLCDLQGYAFNSNDFNSYINKEIQFEDNDVKVIYKNGLRKIIQYKLEENLGDNRLSIKNNGIYVITGALGGLGRALTKYLSTKYSAKLILLGRRETSFVDTKDIEYIKADVSDMNAVNRVMSYIKNKYGKINGIFHCAGVNKDSLLKNKTMDSINSVIKPKVYGLISLIRSVENENIDFIMCFSSIAAIIGNRGQSDYAYANAFMDACAKKYKKVVSINWGLWKSGNMGNNNFIVNKMKEEYDIVPIDDKEGFDIMIDIIASGNKNVSVLKGNNLNILFKQEAVKTKTTQKIVYNNIELIQKVQDDLLKIALQVFNGDEIDNKTCFDDEELDSISLMEFAKIITSKLNTNISVSSLFEFNTVEKLAKHLVEDNKEMLSKKYGLQEKVEILEEAYEEEPFEIETEEIGYNTLEVKEENRDVAIVGISGRFPGADNVEMFWQNLIEGKNNVIETPEERWQLKQFNDDVKAYVKYGGFLNDIDLFDSLYFNISPEEAKLMDPQQRILLEEAVICFENAGINQADLKGKNIDVYVGAFSNDYGKLVDKSDYKYDPNAVAGNDNAMLANRLSYFFNLKGKSEVIDTACSSALVCIYRAVESIRNKKCDGAIAAAVNIILDPKGSIRIGNLGFLSKDGVTKSFDENADGYVRGEGAGVIYLKALDKAIEDKDKILAVIKGGAVNHSGKGHYLMEPNALAEAEVIKNAYEDAKLSIGTVNYLECHGTGTIVGDSNEIYAYKKAFKDLEKDKNINIPKHFCALGTVKPNIGHLESASGMASIIKLIMALKNRKIPKTLVFNEINSEYDLENSMFYINDKLSEWSSIINEEGIELPRRGEVHSYGFGGTNAHLILEEYVENDKDKDLYNFESQYNIFPFSAKTIESLKMYIQDFILFLEGCEDKELNRISYTLQEIKTEYDERVAFVADNKESLIRLLKAYLNNEESKYILCRQNENVLNIIKTLFLEDLENKILNLLKDNNNLIGIAFLWVNKININWKELFDHRSLRKIYLPAYKFTKHSYWIESKEENYVKQETTNKTESICNEDLDFEEEIAKIIAEILGLTVKKIITCENLVDIGLNSIMLTKLKYKIESKLNIKLRMNQLAMKNNFKELLEYVKEERIK